MPDEIGLRSFGEEEVYNFTRRGSFGRFQAGDSFPVEFLMASFTPAEVVEKLTFARDITTAHLDFELLMQRDIDEDRVREEMEPYLNRNLRSAPERRDVVFFPPLLAAVVPLYREEMQEYYPNEACSPVGENYLMREWRPYFRLRYMISGSPDALRVIANGETYNVDRQQVEFSIRLPGSDQAGAKLVVIDGQHRLLAIKRVLEQASDLLRDLIVPVCIVYPPLATLEEQERVAPIQILTVPQVFRSLFVDVNETMRNVGGHFTILLRDDDVPDLTCRYLCANVLSERGRHDLATIEWNIKTRKQSYDINREYSVTSIGILSKSLKALLAKVGRFKYVLNIPEVEDELFPPSADEEEYPRRISASNFSISQKPVLEGQIKKYLVPQLMRILAEIDEFAKARQIFIEEVGKLEERARNAEPGTDTARNARRALQQVLEYRPIARKEEEEGARATLRSLLASIQERRKSEGAAIIRYQLFQRAVFDVWSKTIDHALANEAGLDASVDALMVLVNASLANAGEFFEFSNRYMQEAVFQGHRIKAKEATRKALAHLILAHLGNPSIARDVASKLADAHRDKVAETLQQAGIDEAQSFGHYLFTERKKTFKTTYRVDVSLDAEEREELARAEQTQSEQELERREGKRKDVETVFDDMVEQFVRSEVTEVLGELREALNFEVDIRIADEEDDDIEGEFDSTID